MFKLNYSLVTQLLYYAAIANLYNILNDKPK